MAFRALDERSCAESCVIVGKFQVALVQLLAGAVLWELFDQFVRQYV